jgi:hypothetical protein
VTERFHESQTFRATWLLVVVLLPTAVFGYAVVQQLVLGRPWGDRPMPDAALVATFAIFGLGVPCLWVLLRLDTSVDEHGLSVRFRPFHLRPRRYGFDRLARWEAVTYRPLLDYGGWGIRLGPKGWAFNVSGNRGVRLTFDDGRTLLIGSQRADELVAALDAARRG